MASNYTAKYNVDIVMCIDVTQSMDYLLDTVKKNALNFYGDLVEVMEKKDKHVDQLRIRIIAFRDYIADRENAMLATRFYSLPQEAEQFSSLINSLEPSGGGDEPEDGLEALAYAMGSDWTKEGDRRRHIIVVWSDSATHELGFGKMAGNYPGKMAADFEELTEWWGDIPTPAAKMNYNSKRLLIFAPEEKYWSTVYESWDNVVLFPSEAGHGLEGLQYNQILDEIRNSV
ncbi:MAG: VWA domain-containing protein [Lachnospiraceae bacterium]|nr:VWA domain-containing protein [Lachnospiraceae bacterium]